MASLTADQKRDALRSFMKHTGLKAFPWARASKMSEGTIRAFLNRTSESLTDQTYDKLATGATKLLGREIDPNELRIGRGAHIHADDPEPADDGMESAIRQAQDRLEGIPDRILLVRELDVTPANGANGDLREITRANIEEMTRSVHGFPREGFEQIYGAPGDEVGILTAKGDSNIPDILPGQKVMIHFADRTPSPPGFFMLWDGLGVVIKQVEHIANSEPPRIRISSRNPAYQPYERTLGEAHIFGRVIGNWRRL